MANSDTATAAESTSTAAPLRAGVAAPPPAAAIPNPALVTMVTTSPNFSFPKGWNHVTEAAKLLAIAVFAVYATGFIIWHAYLGQYGITPHGLLRTEFMSAAFCYSMLTFAFAVPGAMLLNTLLEDMSLEEKSQKPKKPDTFYRGLFLVWGVVLQRLNTVFFPDGGASISSDVITYMICAALIHMLIDIGLKHRLSGRGLKILQSNVWPFLYLIGIPATSVFLNSNTSLAFLLMAIILVPGCKAAFVPHLKTYWGEGSHGLRALIVFAFFLVFLSHVHIFATYQFNKIPKSVGGGKPEQAYVKFKTPDTNTASFFGIREENGNFGPMHILLHSDSEIIFLPGEARSATARLVRSDQLAGIRYERTRLPEK
jgi:hypothetical protein